MPSPGASRTKHFARNDEYLAFACPGTRLQEMD